MKGRYFFRNNTGGKINYKTENPGQLLPEGRQTSSGKRVYSVYRKEDKIL